MEYVTHFYMDLGYKNCYVGIMQMQYDGIWFYFIDNEYYFSDRSLMTARRGIWRSLPFFKGSALGAPGDRLPARM